MRSKNSFAQVKYSIFSLTSIKFDFPLTIIEFDYVEEAKNLALIHNAIMPKWSSFVNIPKPYSQYCSKHVLVMEYLEGVKLVDGIRNSYRSIAATTGTTLEELEEKRKKEISTGNYVFQTLEQSKKERELMQWYLTIKDYLLNPTNLWKIAYNMSVFRLIYGPYNNIERTMLPIDLASILDVLCKVHGNELFEHGNTK